MFKWTFSNGSFIIFFIQRVNVLHENPTASLLFIVIFVQQLKGPDDLSSRLVSKMNVAIKSFKDNILLGLLKRSRSRLQLLLFPKCLCWSQVFYQATVFLSCTTNLGTKILYIKEKLLYMKSLSCPLAVFLSVTSLN